MSKKVNIIAMAVLVVLAGLVWIVSANQRNTIKADAATVSAVSMQNSRLPTMQAAQAASPAAIPQSVAPMLSVTLPPPADAAAPDGGTKHIAQPGETVSSLATDMLGKDTKTNRDAIINANQSLQNDPDKLVAGRAYRIPSAEEVPAVAAAAPVTQQPEATSPIEKETVRSEPAKELKYTAAPGDTVAKLANAFLGSDDQTNQDAIINANSSLQADPDHVVAGKAYHIPVPDGLSAAEAPAPIQFQPRPKTQPDADQVVVSSSPRTLRYTAHDGDTVTTLAVQLLGSDTQQARDAIINNNPDLKADPDRVVAGQTYWIPAPAAPVQNP